MLIEQLTRRQLEENNNVLNTKIRCRLCAVLAIWIAVATIAHPAHGQDTDSTASESAGPQVADDSAQTLLPHFEAGRIWLSGQANFISQTNPPFYAQYSGANSFQSKLAEATSFLLSPQLNDSRKKAARLEFLQWALTSGQKECSALAYAPLPHEIANRQLLALDSFK